MVNYKDFMLLEKCKNERERERERERKEISEIFKNRDGFRSQTSKLKSWLYYFIGCVTLGKLLNLPAPQFPPLQSGDGSISSS